MLKLLIVTLICATATIASAAPKPDFAGNSGVFRIIVDETDDEFANCDVSFDQENGLIATSCTNDGFFGLVEGCQEPQNSATSYVQLVFTPSGAIPLFARSHDAYMNVYDWDGDFSQFDDPEHTCKYLTNQTIPGMLLATGRGHDNATDNDFFVAPGGGNAFTRNYRGTLMVVNGAGGTTNLQMRWKGLIEPNGDETITTHIKLTPDPRY